MNKELLQNYIEYNVKSPLNSECTIAKFYFGGSWTIFLIYPNRCQNILHQNLKLKLELVTLKMVGLSLLSLRIYGPDLTLDCGTKRDNLRIASPIDP